MTRVLLKPGPEPGSVTVAFRYDPEVAECIKAVPGRKWVASRHVWTIPSAPESLERLRELLPPRHPLVAEPEVRAAHAQALKALAGATAAKSRGDSDIAYEYKTQPYAHQRAGLEFLAHLGGGALLWEMGTGKTKTAIDYCEWLAGQDPNVRVLVIAPNTVKRNWGAEVRKHAGHEDFDILDGSVAQRVKRLGGARYSVVNCESLSVKAFADAARLIEWDVVVVDESTRFKTPSAARTKALHKLNAKRRVILTGTPITGKPEDAWAQVQFVAPGLLGTFWSFRDRYLALDFWKRPTGVKPGMARDLADKIASRSYRVLKRDVLDLPEKVYADRVVEMSGTQADAYRQMRDDLMVQIDAMPSLTAWNVLTQLLRLTQITAGLIGTGEKYVWMPDAAKVKELDDLLNDELAGEQVVVFGVYQKELEELARRYTKPLREDPDYVAPIIYGPTPERERARIVDEFQAGTRRLLFVQQHTGGIGINLTAAQTAVYHTRSWSLEDYLQSQDRLHRIGQRGTVSIVHLVAKGTIDEDINKALGKKQNLADMLTGDAARRLARDLLEGK